MKRQFRDLRDDTKMRISQSLKGRSFSDIPETMPCYDVTIMGSFKKNDDNVGIDEHVVISDESNKAIYNLRGQRIINPKNGIYIVNGQKVFIKQ